MSPAIKIMSEYTQLLASPEVLHKGGGRLALGEMPAMFLLPGTVGRSKVPAIRRVVDPNPMGNV